MKKYLFNVICLLVSVLIFAIKTDGYTYNSWFWLASVIGIVGGVFGHFTISLLYNLFIRFKDWF